MVTQTKLTQFICDTLGSELLAQAAKVDTVPNCVQIRGQTDVTKVALGVSCSQAFLEQVVAWGAEYCLVHHGLHTSGFLINGNFLPFEARLKYIFAHQLTLAGFHYALDAHPTLGNNAQIIKALGAVLKEPYFEGWGFVGELARPFTPAVLAQKLQAITGHAVYHINTGPAQIKRLGVCSGGAKPNGPELLALAAQKIDAHITGEISEGVPPLAEAIGYHYYACGHYATETFGVKALGAALSAHFGSALAVKFIDLPTDL